MQQTQGKPLSGEEVRKTIVYDIERALSLDDNFAAHIAYTGGFSFHASLVISLPSAVNSQVTRSVTGGRGEILLPSDTVVTVEAERDVEPHDHVRIDTEQPVPVLVETAQGQIKEEFIKYAKKDLAGKPGIPRQKKNTVRGIDAAQ